MSLRCFEGGDARDDELVNNAAAVRPGGPHKRQFYDSPKRRDKSMIDKLVVKLLTLKMRLSDERGQDIMEYAILTGGIAIALVTALAFFTTKLDGWFTAVGNFFTQISPQ